MGLTSGDYTTLFTRLGRFVAQQNLWLTYQGINLLGSGYGADLIAAQYSTRRDLIDGMQTKFEQMATGVTNWSLAIEAYANATLLDISDNLNVSNSLSAVLDAMFLVDMPAVSVSVPACQVAITSASVPTSWINPGNSDPSTFLTDITDVYGNNDERIFSEILMLTVASDRFTTGPGNEILTLTGFPKPPSVNSYLPRGNGTINFPIANSATANKLSNGSFTSVSGTTSAATFTSWTLGATGSMGYSTSVIHGQFATNSAIFTGAAGGVSLSQSVAGKIKPSTKYVAGAFCKSTSPGTFTLSLSGSGGYAQTVPGASQTSALTSFTLVSGFFNTPAGMPPDASFKLNWSGTAGTVFVDDVALAEATSFGNVYYAAFRGNLDFVIGDRFVFSTRGGGLAGAKVLTAGSGQTNGTFAGTISGGLSTLSTSATSATGYVTIAGGVLTGFTVTSPGQDYVSPPTITYSSGAGVVGTLGASVGVFQQWVGRQFNKRVKSSAAAWTLNDSLAG